VLCWTETETEKTSVDIAWELKGQLFQSCILSSATITQHLPLQLDCPEIGYRNALMYWWNYHVRLTSQIRQMTDLNMRQKYSWSLISEVQSIIFQ
jgi:hypothetical protein